MELNVMLGKLFCFKKKKKKVKVWLHTAKKMQGGNKSKKGRKLKELWYFHAGSIAEKIYIWDSGQGVCEVMCFCLGKEAHCLLFNTSLRTWL